MDYSVSLGILMSGVVRVEDDLLQMICIKQDLQKIYLKNILKRMDLK